MKNLYLLFGFALMGVLFFACQKDEPVVEEIAVEGNEMVSVERSCGQDPLDCLTTCISEGMCCCTIEWYYDGTGAGPVPTFCVAKDICVRDPDCVIECAQTNWPGNSYNFCASGPTTLTYLCVSKNTAISITNPTHFDLYVELICSDGSPNPPPPSLYVIPGFTTIQIGFNGCNNHLGC